MSGIAGDDCMCVRKFTRQDGAACYNGVVGNLRVFGHNGAQSQPTMIADYACVALVIDYCARRAVHYCMAVGRAYHDFIG